MIARQTAIMRFFSQLMLVTGLAALASAAPAPQDDGGGASSWWLSSIERNGAVPFGDAGDYPVFRNVKEFGALGELLEHGDGIDRSHHQRVFVKKLLTVFR